jgi:hypothetical protein
MTAALSGRSPLVAIWCYRFRRGGKLASTGNVLLSVFWRLRIWAGVIQSATRGRIYHVR